MAATAYAEDAASVLGAWIYDGMFLATLLLYSPANTYNCLAANLPAEIRHLFDEIQAKNAEFNSVSNSLEQRDLYLQAWIRQNGSTLEEHPKEKQYSEQIRKSFIRMLQLQDQKIALVEKAMKLVRYPGFDSARRHI